MLTIWPSRTLTIWPQPDRAVRADARHLPAPWILSFAAAAAAGFRSSPRPASVPAARPVPRKNCRRFVSCLGHRLGRLAASSGVRLDVRVRDYPAVRVPIARAFGDSLEARDAHDPGTRRPAMADDPDRPAGRPHDPRMRGFRDRASVEDVLALIDRRVRPLGPETVGCSRRPGGSWRPTSSRASPCPAFDRAAMDGYAVRGEETFGASPYSPAVFALVGRGPAGPAVRGDGRAGRGGRDHHRLGAARRGRRRRQGRVDRDRRPDRLGRRADPARPARRPSRRGHRGRDGRAPRRAGAPAAGPRRARAPSGGGEVAVVRRPRVAVIVTGDELLARGRPRGGAGSPT